MKRTIRRRDRRDVRTFRITQLAHGEKLYACVGEWGAILCLHFPTDEHFLRGCGPCPRLGLR